MSPRTTDQPPRRTTTTDTDELMGVNRNLDNEEGVIDDFRDERVCKAYLCGLCPHDLFRCVRGLFVWSAPTCCIRVEVPLSLSVEYAAVVVFHGGVICPSAPAGCRFFALYMLLVLVFHGGHCCSFCSLACFFALRGEGVLPWCGSFGLLCMYLPVRTAPMAHLALAAVPTSRLVHVIVCLICCSARPVHLFVGGVGVSYGWLSAVLIF